MGNINELFSTKARLGIMTIIVQQQECDFSKIKEMLGLSDGNLGAHLRVLEDAGYILVKKEFVKRRPKSTYTLSDTGRQAFMAHLTQLESIIHSVNKATEPENSQNVVIKKEESVKKRR